jgi:hypothetical protein
MSRKRSGAWGFAALCLAAIAALAACATVPRRAADARWIDVLPADATMYLSVDIAANRALLGKVLEGTGPEWADVATMLDMSRRALIAVYLRPPEPLRYQVVALGSYPAFLIGLRLGTNADWKRVETSSGGYFRNGKNLQASFPGDEVLLASTDGMEGLLERLYHPVGFALPPWVEAAMGSSDAVLFLPRFPGGLGGENASLPIREVWIEAKVDHGSYAVSGTVAVESERSARSVALILRLALVSWLNTEKVENVAEKLKSISIAPDGPSVKVSGLVFPGDEVLSLFRSLLQLAPAGTTR